MNNTLETRRVRLRSLEDSDTTTLFEWRNDSEFLRNCSNRGSVESCDEFAKEFKRDFERDRHLQFMIERKLDGKPIGTIYSYNYRRIDGYVFITTYLIEGFRKRGYGAEADVLFLNYLFETFGLYKIYMEMYEYNQEALSAARGGGFMEEGRFKKQRLFNGMRYDVFRYAIFKDSVPRMIEFLKRLQ